MLALLLGQTLLAAAGQLDRAAAAAITQYRVYQNDKPLLEFANEAQAIAYARQYSYSHVEKIAERQWIRDHFPRYKVYQNGVTNAKLEFSTQKLAKKYDLAGIAAWRLGYESADLWKTLLQAKG